MDWRDSGESALLSISVLSALIESTKPPPRGFRCLSSFLEISEKSPNSGRNAPTLNRPCGIKVSRSAIIHLLVLLNDGGSIADAIRIFPRSPRPGPIVITSRNRTLLRNRPRDVVLKRKREREKKNSCHSIDGDEFDLRRSKIYARRAATPIINLDYPAESSAAITRLRIISVADNIEIESISVSMKRDIDSRLSESLSFAKNTNKGELRSFRRGGRRMGREEDRERFPPCDYSVRPSACEVSSRECTDVQTRARANLQ